MDNRHLEINEVHIFRPVWWYSAAVLLSSLMLIFTISIPVLIFGPLLVAYVLKDGITVYSLLGMIFLFPFVILALATCIYRGSICISIFFAFIKTTPDGIQYKYWPFANIYGKWQDVDKINSPKLTGKVIWLNKYEKLGRSISFTGFFNRLRKTDQGMIPLKDVFRSKETTLLNEVQKYAPQLFEQEIRSAAPQIVRQESKAEAAAVPSNPNIALVFMSHISVMFGFAGILIPGIILLIQSGKPGQQKNQTLQALVWQIFAVVTKSIFFFLVIAVLTPVFTIFSNLQVLNPDMLVFLTVIILLLAVLVIYLPFVIFPIIGIIKIAQGKDFRYPIIGRIIRN
jgi:uncharacterized Tic20 family protein